MSTECRGSGSFFWWVNWSYSDCNIVAIRNVSRNNGDTRSDQYINVWLCMILMAFMFISDSENILVVSPKQMHLCCLSFDAALYVITKLRKHNALSSVCCYYVPKLSVYTWSSQDSLHRPSKLLTSLLLLASNRHAYDGVQAGAVGEANGCSWSQPVHLPLGGHHKPRQPHQGDQRE